MALSPPFPDLVGVEFPPLRPAGMEAAVVVNGVRPGGGPAKALHYLFDAIPVGAAR